MSDNLISRRKFLVGAGTVVGAASLVGFGMAKSPSEAAATPAGAPPWPYPTVEADQPIPETLARHAYEVYYAAGCAEATWWPIVEFLGSKTDSAYATTWGTLPRNLFKYGGGGVGGWGTLCGTCNGSSAIIAMCGGPGKITDEIMQYYAETPIPTNGIDKAVAATWTPQPFGTDAQGQPITAPNPKPNVPTSTAHSQLCHASLSQWTMTTSKPDGGADQKDRCAKACYDMVLKTTQLLNAYFLNKTNIPLGALDSSVSTCGAVVNGCHVSAKGKMACDSCHDNTTTDGHQHF